jgi:hypothetical protein
MWDLRLASPVAIGASGFALLLSSLSLLGACAEAGDKEQPVGPTVDWSSSASGGTGGSGGSSLTSSSVGGMSTGGAGGSGGSGATGGSGGSSPNGRLIMLAAGTSSALGATYVPMQGWSSGALTGSSDSGVSVTFTTSGDGVGVMRASGSQLLRYTTFTNGSWAAFADVASTITTSDTPALGSASSAAQLVFRGLDDKHYFGSFVSSWTPSAEPVTPMNMAQSIGPSAAAIVELGAQQVIAFVGNDNSLYVQTRASGSWQNAVNLTGSKAAVSPALVVPTSGPELLVVYAHAEMNQVDDRKLYWASRTSGTWTTPVKIDDAVFSDDPPTLAALAGGDVLLSYRGTDGAGYSARWSSGSWGAAAPIGNPNPQVISTPAVSEGLGTAEAELVYITGGAANHVTLTGTSWSAATAIGGSGLTHCAIAAMP